MRRGRDNRKWRPNWALIRAAIMTKWEQVGRLGGNWHVSNVQILVTLGKNAQSTKAKYRNTIKKMVKGKLIRNVMGILAISNVRGLVMMLHGRTKAMEEIRNDRVRFDEVGNDSPGNPVISLEGGADIPDENRVNFDEIEVLLPNGAIWRNDWRINHRCK